MSRALLPLLTLGALLCTVSVASAVERFTGELTAQSQRDGNKPYNTYSVELGANELVEISMTGSFDTYLKLQGPGVSATDDDSGAGNNARLTARVPGGTYTIHAMGYNQSALGSYTVTVRRHRPLDESANITGELTADDHMDQEGKRYDNALHNLSEGQTQVVDLSASQFDPVLIAGMANGARLADDDGGEGRDSRLMLPNTVGPVLFTVTHAGQQNQGNYTLKITNYEEIDPEPEPVPTSEIQNLEGSGELDGTLAPGDFVASGQGLGDRYKIQMSAGQYLRVDMSSELDDFLQLSGPNNFNVTDDDGGEGNNARLIVEIPQDGDYIITARTYGNGRHLGAYHLKVQRMRLTPIP